ncbi:hypothetical protein ACFL2V_14280 [Pseudomonadota bacterium]
MRIVKTAFLVTGMFLLGTASASPWDNNETEIVLPSGGVKEECFLVESPVVLKYKFSASDGLLFNIHYHHHHTGMEYPVPISTKSGVDESEIKLTVPSAHCLMWENSTGEKDISVNYSFIIEKL